MRVTTILAIAVAVVLGLCRPAGAQQWARKMFDKTSHDFGYVARGAKIHYRFRFKNLYKETVHVASVRSSCGCTTPKLTKRTLKSLETSEIVAQYNTLSFLGRKSAVVTVVIDQPFPAEVQLHVKGYIRQDVVFSPGGVNFGRVSHGQRAEKRLDVAYAGRNDWRIIDVRTSYPHLEAELVEKSRGGGRVNYQLLVRLLGDAPVGYVKQQLYVITNDANQRRMPLDVEGKIESELTVSPGSLFLGVLKPGDRVTKKLLVRAKKPFRVLNVECDDDCFTFENPPGVKPFHVIPVTFAADKKTGKVSQTIHIKTDLGQGAVADVLAYAQIADK